MGVTRALWFIETRARLLGCYLFLVAASVYVMSTPGVFWQPFPVWMQIVVATLLVASFLGCLIRSTTVRALGWVGIVWFTFLVFVNTFWSDYVIAQETWNGPIAPPHPADSRWRVLLFLADVVLLVVLFKKLGESSENPGSKRFFVLLRYGVVIAVSALAVLEIEQPPGGMISLKYIGPSKIGYSWEMDNFSNRSIYVLLTDNMVWPGSVTIRCEMSRFPENLVFRLTAGEEPSVFKVYPFARVRLDVAASFPNEDKGELCRLQLSLRGGALVESDAFRIH